MVLKGKRQASPCVPGNRVGGHRVRAFVEVVDSQVSERKDPENRGYEEQDQKLGCDRRAAYLGDGLP